MIKDIEGAIEVLTKHIRGETDIAVLGMSGGADSTLVAILCKMALGGENVYSVHMPYDGHDFKGPNTVSIDIAEKLDINCRVIPIYQPVDAVVDAMEIVPGTLNDGNIRSRIRMVVLYTYARELLDSGKVKGTVRVIGTGNLSEDFIGYDTKGGDALADFFPIGDLFKSEVYQLLDYFVEQGVIDDHMVNRTPSAGLWDGQTDYDELGYTYDEMEPAIRGLRHGEDVAVDSKIVDFVLTRHKQNLHKHSAPKVCLIRDQKEIIE